MRKTLMTAFTLAAFSSAANADYRSSVDEDGCWDARDSYGANCMTLVDAHRENGRAEVTYKNKCSQRIYARICLTRVGKADSCGQSSMRPGQEFTWYTHSSAGQQSARSIGSTSTSNDWVCTGKVRGWRN
ncbi:hypothetical protein K3152_02225 [Qipengyuania sp. 1NDH17]|uniref:DUF3011 domain-containing protein n=1 Tax=Qipengyuania polymorpha TaxID=2867234 RepID=A0ABS7IUI4_9SPHN|nr:hypothetical protein [Qipengyuania polymorpha]MBX7457052.1 hypothetical protein [Qipengyuania polymorpha]